jgi:4-diphosphocytidyl-2-C-methyl-D-erythritol kinase
MPPHAKPDLQPPLEPLLRCGPDGVEARAPAKINLTLSVAARREDGFHPLDSIVAKVSLYDRIRMRRISRPGVELCADEALCGPPGENLACLAARAYLAAAGIDAGVAIELDKRIPAGGGLAGGSSDAAAVLRGLESLFDRPLAAGERMEIAAGLGSDVPLFLAGPASRMQGRGEVLSPAEVRPFAALLLVPPLSCPTGAVYGRFDELPPPPRREFNPALLADRPPSAWREALFNDLAEAACSLRPELASLRDRLRSALAVPVHLSGSGSTLFSLFDDADAALAAVEALPPEEGLQARLVVSNPW